MNIHEFQAKMVLGRAGIPIPRFGIARTVEEAVEIYQDLGLSSAVVKIQVHAGGRGKAGGVKFAKSLAELRDVCTKLIGMKMVNEQTGPAGIVANQVMISEPADIKHEYYMGAIIDRESAKAILIASPAGGMDIEKVAEETPEQILKLDIALDGSLKDVQLKELADKMGWRGDQAVQGCAMATILAKSFMDTDASLLEINPLISDKSGKLWALDAKLAVDDNALFRQPEIAAFYDPTQISENEVEAKKFGLEYVGLSGNIGCMVNGAGLAMATMDIISYYGKDSGCAPANFLDVGGSASKEKVAEALKIILKDPLVKTIFINIFGGIMSCKVLAEGVIAAVSELGVKVPLVVRFEGTDVESGKRLLRESGLQITAADSLKDGAQKAVAAAGGK